MASKLPVPLLSAAKYISTWSHRIVKFFKHRMLTQKKNILIIGEQNSSLYKQLYPSLVKTWEVTHLVNGQPPKPEIVDQVESAQLQKSIDKAQDIPVENKAAKQKPLLTKLFLHNSNYAQIEKLLEGRQFDSIIVLPTDSKTKAYNIWDQEFVTAYPTIHQELQMRNVFAYRLASKYLTSSGVIILSASERDFIENSKAKDAEEKDIRNIWDSNQIVDAQTLYLGVTIGDRDFTDLNSWSIVALSKQAAEEVPNFVSQYYRAWADSQRLPMPGSFALFRRASPNIKQRYVQYQ